MAAKAKATTKPRIPRVAEKLPAAKSSSMTLTMEERLHRIETMRKRIDGYIEYICQIGKLTGASAEVKERAVTIFYEQMLVVERELGRTHDELRLE